MTTTTMPTGEELHYAQVAHHRLLMDADAGLALRRTSYDALHALAERTRTTNVPQIADALAELKRNG